MPLVRLINLCKGFYPIVDDMQPILGKKGLLSKIDKRGIEFAKELPLIRMNAPHGVQELFHRA